MASISNQIQQAVTEYFSNPTIANALAAAKLFDQDAAELRAAGRNFEADDQATEAYQMRRRAYGENYTEKAPH